MRSHQDGPEEKIAAQIAFDYCFLGSEGEDRTALVLATNHRRTQLIFANVVPRKWLEHEDVAWELCRDIQKPSNDEVMFQCGGGPVWKQCERGNEDGAQGAGHAREPDCWGQSV